MCEYLCWSDSSSKTTEPLLPIPNLSAQPTQPSTGGFQSVKHEKIVITEGAALFPRCWVCSYVCVFFPPPVQTTFCDGHLQLNEVFSISLPRRSSLLLLLLHGYTHSLHWACCEKEGDRWFKHWVIFGFKIGLYHTFYKGKRWETIYHKYPSRHKYQIYISHFSAPHSVADSLEVSTLWTRCPTKRHHRIPLLIYRRYMNSIQTCKQCKI